MRWRAAQAKSLVEPPFLVECLADLYSSILSVEDGQCPSHATAIRVLKKVNTQTQVQAAAWGVLKGRWFKTKSLRRGEETVRQEYLYSSREIPAFVTKVRDV